MNIENHIDENGVVLAIEGRVTMQTSHLLLTEIKNLLSNGTARIFILLDSVEYMDSSGVGVLISGLKLARKNNVPLGLVAPNQRVSQIMEMSGLVSIFPVFPDLTGARAGLS